MGTNSLLHGLNTLPSAPAESNEEAANHFANQLSLWTTASFSFDGPMGHALIADDEKDEKKDKVDDRVDDEERHRAMAASSAHSNAARDKMRALDRDPVEAQGGMPQAQNLPGPTMPPLPTPISLSPASFQHLPGSTAPVVGATSHAVPHAPTAATSGNATEPHIPWTSSFAPPSVGTSTATPASTSARGAENGGAWDLTSTLALQYLLSKNPSMLSNLWPNGVPPSAVASSSSSSSSNTPAPAMNPSVWPPTAPTFTPPSQGGTDGLPLPTLPPRTDSNASSLPSLQRKRSFPASTASASTQASRGSGDGSNSPTGLASTSTSASSSQAAPARGRAAGSTLAVRVKLVDTGNPEADAEANRLAIEEDKRRRNTAASARFRIKKKQREAALEMSARELEAQVHELKQENERLRTENDWLRRLITSRPDGLSTLFGASMPTVFGGLPGMPMPPPVAAPSSNTQAPPPPTTQPEESAPASFPDTTAPDSKKSL